MRLAPACLLSVLPLLPAFAFAQAGLPTTVEAAFSRTNVPVQAFSAIVMPASGGQPVLLQAADRPMNPASAMKLVTTIVALEELGPTFRWKTQILADKSSKKDIYTGNLYLRGGGEPNLTIEKLGSMLRSLRNQGLRRLRGDIILDRSYFQPERPDIGAAQFDEFPDAYYNVIPDALLVNSNLSSISLESTTDKIEARLNTPLDKVKIVNHLHFNELPCSAWETEWQPPVIETVNNMAEDPETDNPNAPASKKPLRQTTKAGLEITLNGGFPKRCKITNNINILDRNQYLAHLIRALWQEMGGTWQGEVRDGKTPASATVLAERQSEPLADILRIINKQSDNVMARMLYLTLGAESANKQGMTNLQAADARIRQWLFRQGINDAGLVLENGSGLSRIERISPQQMAGLLQVAARSNWYAEFASSLPVASMDGTMRRRLKGGPAELRARIKTGTLKDVVAIAGYVRDINDQQWIVAAMINHDEAVKAKAALDELITWVAAGRP
ncbi:D-alanyl-D-alanine carboxypeptidase/D-alanyl-D-alanine-endopeptidase [Undibacterium sp. KW1]|uniref:D-alanyl-D-alanine carboxypeptidase/D-alanyl-D-alanine endopeptidase n=1 Tax=Undibacterium sp. KW1 TaxID=2058624 RepID=UPI001389FE08|nr:D-alanyl-D-alanine carboxypeptidase/D-alanyl-D-alanine-endopeptidase [Undibacterium sp. KW1]